MAGNTSRFSLISKDSSKGHSGFWKVTMSRRLTERGLFILRRRTGKTTTSACQKAGIELVDLAPDAEEVHGKAPEYKGKNFKEADKDIIRGFEGEESRLSPRYLQPQLPFLLAQ